MRTVVWFLFAFLNILSLPFLVLRAKIIKRRRGEGACRAYAYKKTLSVCKFMLSLAGAEIEICGRENIPKNAAAVFAPNHSGLFDAPVMCAACSGQCFFALKKQLASIPFVKQWMSFSGSVFIDRDNAVKAVESTENAVKSLKSGSSLVMFPEGTRSKNGIPGKVKTGVFRISYSAGVPVVPVIIKGTRDVYEKNGRITPGKISVEFLPALGAVNDVSHACMQSLTKELYDIYYNKLVSDKHFFKGDITGNENCN